ncbi:kinesin motor domain-containing protein [Colletotrichum melonis]|uniref:Kinesin motor domain-containing protein n=1 Tax=Colletotrichum melonis TaxID=1209925 RepID=A0AAI9V337_9PEZI|nr:kinesin motor domain-containing protein [Colletotrichum melonis]
MDTAENTQHHFRSSVMRPHSNLPRPGAFTSGLSEMNEAQSNARAHPSMIPPPGASKIGSLNSAMNLKREVPKPGWSYYPPGLRWDDWLRLLTVPSTAEHSATKHHKTLAERAGEYPTKPSSAAAGAGASGIARAPSVRRVPGSTLAERPVSLDMAPESTTASSIVLQLDGLRTILWIAVHLFRSIRHIWRAVIQAASRSFLWQKLLASFPLPWHRNTLRRPRSRPQNGPSIPTPTYMRSISGRLQLWLGLQSDGDNTRSCIRLLLDAEAQDAEAQDAECYQAMECDDETDDRDELRCVPPNARSLQPHVVYMLTRSSSKIQIISDLEMGRRHHDTIRTAASPRASAPEAMNVQNPPLLTQSRYTDSPGPETPIRIRDRARHMVIDLRKSLMDQ